MWILKKKIITGDDRRRKVSAEYWTGVRLSILNSLCHCPAV
jgi:hypothetical protein